MSPCWIKLALMPKLSISCYWCHKVKWWVNWYTLIISAFFLINPTLCVENGKAESLRSASTSGWSRSRLKENHAIFNIILYYYYKGSQHVARGPKAGPRQKNKWPAWRLDQKIIIFGIKKIVSNNLIYAVFTLILSVITHSKFAWRYITWFFFLFVGRPYPKLYKFWA